MISIVKTISVALIFAIFSTYAYAQTKVVIIPMAGDDLKPLANIITVAKENGDFTGPVAAMASITDASASKPYLLVIAPGYYTLTSPLQMQANVVISGSGEYATILGGIISASDPASSAIVIGADNASIHDLTIENTSTAGNRAYGIYNDSSSPIISNLRIRLSGEGTQMYGIYNVSSSAIISDCQIEINSSGSSSRGISSSGSSPRISDCEIDIKVSNQSGSHVGIASSGTNMILSNTRIHIDGGNRISGIYSASGMPQISDVSIELHNANSQYGIDFQSGSLRVSEPYIDIHDGQNGGQYGIYARSIVQLSVMGGEIKVNGDSAQSKYGFFHYAAGDTMLDGLRITVGGSAGSQYAVFNRSSTTRAIIRNSILEGSTADVTSYALTSSSGKHTYISNSILLGGGVFGAAARLHCDSVFDETNPAAPVEIDEDCS